MNAVPGLTKDIEPILRKWHEKRDANFRFLDCKKDIAYVFCKFATVNPVSDAENVCIK